MARMDASVVEPGECTDARKNRAGDERDDWNKRGEEEDRSGAKTREGAFADYRQECFLPRAVYHSPVIELAEDCIPFPAVSVGDGLKVSKLVLSLL